ncbi:hypothetical protein B5X24_HaOG204147 [Helicoverpa armigera]|uniref:Uncharacterized protein n=1 Tax=Helicoverpa armigera TaxID=29058 RepID=A0A2W1BNX1_HELAM|nr:hypothetical protein B5X24_HaOG204147 [Helicoverpa armigera]
MAFIQQWTFIGRICSKKGFRNISLFKTENGEKIPPQCSIKETIPQSPYCVYFVTLWQSVGPDRRTRYVRILSNYQHWVLFTSQIELETLRSNPEVSSGITVSSKCRNQGVNTNRNIS